MQDIVINIYSVLLIHLVFEDLIVPICKEGTHFPGFYLKTSPRKNNMEPYVLDKSVTVNRVIT